MAGPRQVPRRAPWLLVAVALLAAVPAAAEPLTPPPPPRSPRSRPLHEELRRWHLAVSASCLPAARDDGAMNRLAAAISRHPVFPDQTAYADYFNQTLLPAYAAALAGVAGFGSYVDVYVRAQRARRDLAAGLPHGPAATEAELAAFVGAWRAYEARAAAIHAWLAALRAASPCHRDPTLATQPLFEGFAELEQLSEPAGVAARLAEIRDGLVPTFHGGAEVEALVAEIDGPTPPDLRRAGELAAAGVKLLGEIERLARPFALLPLWAELYEGAARAALLARPAAASEESVRVRLALAQLVRGLEPPAAAATDRALLKIAGDLAKGRAGKVLSLRLLGGKATAPDVETLRFAFVGDGRPLAGWPDLPDLPSAEVCALVIGVGKRHLRGADVPLKRWIFEEETRIPVPCKSKDRPGRPL